MECSQIANALQVCLVLGCNVGSTKKGFTVSKKRKALRLLRWMLLSVSVDRSSVLPVCGWTRSTLDATVIKKTKQEVVGNVLISEGNSSWSWFGVSHVHP